MALGMESGKRARTIGLLIFLAGVFVFLLCWACVQPLNVSPDESMRYDIVKFIVQNGYLPDGRDPSIRNEIWGISYAFYPILSYMIMAIPAKIVSLLTTSAFAMVMAARMVNVVFGTITAYLTFRISEILFTDRSKYLFTALVVFLPGQIFIHTYVNNDSMAILSTAWITWVWLRSMKEGWTKKLCVHLACAISMCALSYFNAYGFILCSIIFFFTTILVEKTAVNKAKYVASRTLLIVILVLVLAGWWFIRNYLLYGDFLGWNITTTYAEMYAMDGYKPSQRLNLAQQGVSIKGLLMYPGVFSGNWTTAVAISFVGTFGFLNVFMPSWLSWTYLVIFAVGAVGVITCLISTFRLRKNRQWYTMGFFNWCMLLVIIITIGLLIYYNLYSDLQAQGRYLMPMVIPFMYFVTLGLKRLLELIVRNETVRGRIYLVFSALLVVSAVFVFATVFYPEYAALPK